MSNAIERFYENSHQTNTRGKPVSIASMDDALSELSSPSHRYHCAFAHLKRKPGTVVELGFGSPRLLAALAQGCPTYTVVDIVDRLGGAALPTNILFKKADLCEDFPFPDGSVDCTIAMMIIEHLFDPFHSFREMARITKRGGKAFVNLPNICSIRCRLQLLMGQMPMTSSANWYEKREWDGNHLHYFTVADTVKVADLSGLRLDAIHSVGGLLWLKKIRPHLFCHGISYEFT